jgi:multiple sugar transport system ATP-binding protein
MASISIRNLAKSFGRTSVIANLSLDIPDREFVVFVGPSGCGKSTLLRIIAGLEPMTSGEVFIGDKLVNDLPAAKRNIAMVFQDYALYPHMTVYDNMSFALELRGLRKAEIDTKVKRAAEMLHIEPFLQRKPKELSGGQRQRVAMGRAIVRDPQVFLFDEPLSNLDAKLRSKVRAEIKSLSQQLKTTMILVTHDQVEAMTMADRIVVLQDGAVQQYDTSEQVYERPANQFVASFIGSPTMNFFPVELRDGIVVFANGEPAPPINGEDFARLRRVGGRGILGIRPEHFTVEEQAAHSITVVVNLVEPLGSDTMVHFDLAGTPAIGRVDPALRPKVGDRLALGVQPGRVHLFDAATGQVLA